MSLFSATIVLKRITEITPQMLKEQGIEYLLLDVDNTLSTHHGTILIDGLKDWIEATLNSGIKLMVVSNSKRKRIEPFAAKIGLPFVSLALKPLPFGYNKAVKALNANKKNSAIVGDQIFTDVLGGNLSGVQTVLVEPFHLEDTASFKVKRKLEGLFFKRDYSKLKRK